MFQYPFSIGSRRIVSESFEILSAPSGAVKYYLYSFQIGFDWLCFSPPKTAHNHQNANKALLLLN